MDNFQGPYLEVKKINNQLIMNESFRNLRPDIRKELISCCHEVMTTKVPKKFARHIQDSFYDLSILPVADADGSITAAVATGFSRSYNKIFPLFQDIIFDNIPIVLFYLELQDGDYIFRSVNKAFLETTGLNHDDVVGKRVKEVIPPTSHDLVFTNYERAIKEKRVIYWEEKSVYPSGVKFGEVSVIPVFDEADWPIGLIGTVQDITDRKIAELELKKNFNLLNAIVEGTTDAVFIKDLEGRYIMMNTSTTHFHGRTEEEMQGHSDFELTNSPVAELYSKNDQEVIRTNKAKTFLEEGTLGGRYQCFLSLKAPYKDPEGNVIGIIGLSRDITELKESQRALEESQKELESYAKRVKMLSDLSVAFSKAQLHLEKICQIIVEEASNTFNGGAILELLNEDGKLELKCLYHHDKKILDLMNQMINSQVLNTDSDLQFEKIIKGRAEGLEKLGLKYVYLIPLKALDVPLGILKITGTDDNSSHSDMDFLKTFSDRSALAISNATLFRKANEAVQLREDFIQVASHELRTPLTPLKLQLGLLKKFISKEHILTTPEGKELLRLMQGADKQVVRLKNLIDDLIDVTKFSTDRIILHLEQRDLLLVIKHSISKFVANNQDAKINLDLPDEKEFLMTIDADRIDQAMQKLLANGLQFGLHKPVTVTVRKGTSGIRICIEDSGLGIPAKDQKRIFERFERGLSVNSYGGLGMGLFITKKIIEAHGGKLSLESEVQKGSIFRIELPFR